MSTPDRRKRVLCAGAMAVDTLVRPFVEVCWGTTSVVDAIETRVGGSAANTARALGILQVPVRVAGVLGRDHEAEIIRQELARCHVDMSMVQIADGRSPQTVVLINDKGHRQFLHLRGCSETAFSNGLDFASGAISDVAHFHIASFYVVPHLRSQAPSMLRHARARGFTTSLDTSWDPDGEWMKVLEPCLPHLSILFMNEDEACELAGGGAIEDLARTALRHGTAMLVVKQSQDGCSIYTESGKVVCAAYSVTARDTTGAGDCFVAGFLAAYLRGDSLERAGSFANAAGALSVQHIGAVEGLLTGPEQEAWMARTPLRIAAR